MNRMEKLEKATAIGFDRLQERSIEFAKSCIERRKKDKKLKHTEQKTDTVKSVKK